MTKPLRAALYARFSTDLQRDASIEDQLRSCRAFATKQGIEVVEVYSDRAISGASRNLWCQTDAQRHAKDVARRAGRTL